jgi:hypothetical protein
VKRKFSTKTERSNRENLGRAQAGSRLKTERAKTKRKVLVEVMQTQTDGNLARIRQVLLVLM